jgi:hypothetical protein
MLPFPTFLIRLAGRFIHVKDTLRFNPAMFFPSAKGIDKIERVVYEFLGIAWATLSGQIKPQNLIEPEYLNRVKRDGFFLNIISFYQIENPTRRILGKQPKQQ